MESKEDIYKKEIIKIRAEISEKKREKIKQKTGSLRESVKSIDL